MQSCLPTVLPPMPMLLVHLRQRMASTRGIVTRPVPPPAYCRESVFQECTNTQTHAKNTQQPNTQVCSVCGQDTKRNVFMRIEYSIGHAHVVFCQVRALATSRCRSGHWGAEPHTSPLELLTHTTASRGSSPGPIERGPCLVAPFFPLDEVQSKQRGKSRRSYRARTPECKKKV